MNNAINEWRLRLDSKGKNEKDKKLFHDLGLTSERLKNQFIMFSLFSGSIVLQYKFRE